MSESALAQMAFLEHVSLAVTQEYGPVKKPKSAQRREEEREA